MAMKLKDKTVKVLKETAKEYAVMIMGEKVGSVTKLRQNQWQLRIQQLERGVLLLLCGLPGTMFLRCLGGTYSGGRSTK